VRVRLEQFLNEQVEVWECPECRLIALYGRVEPEDDEQRTCAACDGTLLRVLP
jgi:hypothetical protein